VSIVSSFKDKVNSLVQIFYKFHPHEERSPVNLVTGPVLNLQKDWLNNQIQTCNRCESICDGNRTIIRGDLETATALIIGDSPSVNVYNSEEPCFPFELSPEYESLNDRFEEEQILHYLMWCNVVNCHTHRHNPKGEYVTFRVPTTQEVNSCKGYLFNLMDCMIMSERLCCIMTMGSYALNVLFDNTKISDVRGTELYYRGIPVFPTWSPINLSERRLEEFNEDIDSFVSFLRDE
jgi:uracil-DNA glycosylase